MFPVWVLQFSSTAADPRLLFPSPLLKPTLRRLRNDCRRKASPEVRSPDVTVPCPGRFAYVIRSLTQGRVTEVNGSNNLELRQRVPGIFVVPIFTVQDTQTTRVVNKQSIQSQSRL